MSYYIGWLCVLLVVGAVVTLCCAERYAGAYTTRTGIVEQGAYTGRFVADYRYADPREKVGRLVVRLEDGSTCKAKVKPGGYAPVINDCVIVGTRQSLFFPGHTYVTGVHRPATMGA